MKFLSIVILGNTRMAGFYTAQYEQVFDVVAPKKENKHIIKVKAPVNNSIVPAKNTPAEKFKRLRINWFAGPHNVLDPRIAQ